VESWAFKEAITMQNATAEVATSSTSDPATARLERRRQQAARRGIQVSNVTSTEPKKPTPTRQTPAGWDFQLFGDPVGVPVAG